MPKKILAGLAGTFLVGQALAASFDNNATWDSSAVVNTGTPGDTYQLFSGATAVIDYEGERDVKNQRPLMQTFQLPKNVLSLTVSEIFFQYNGAGGAFDTIDLIFFALDDVFARGTPADDDIATIPPAGGTEIWRQSIDINGQVGNVANNFTMRIFDLAGPTLTQTTGNAGYGFMLFNPDTDGLFPFKWAAERDEPKIPSVADGSLGPYPFGRPYSDNPGSFQEEHDLSLALGGRVTRVPDTGASLALLGLSISALALLRRRFA